MILATIAGDPATPAGLMRHLCQFALPTAHHQSPNAAIRRALAGNLSLPAVLARDLLREHPTLAGTVFSRPGMDVRAALDILDGSTNAAWLRPALAHVPDPDGTLATYALERAPKLRIWQDVTGNRATALPLRRHAALALAACAARTQQDRRDICDVAYRDPDALPALMAAAADANLRADLREVHAHLNNKVEPGTRAWFLRPQTTTQAVLDALAETDDVAVWRTALEEHDDPTGRVARAAVAFVDAAPAGRKSRLVPLLARVVRDVRLPLEVRHGALLAWARSGISTPGSVRDEAAILLRDAPVDVVSGYARAVRGAHELAAVLARTDLPAHVLYDLEECALDEDVPPHHVASLDLTHPLTFGVALAAHPHADRRQRHHGLTLVNEYASGLAGTVDAVFLARARTIAEVAQHLAHEPAAHVGARLPVAALGNQRLCSLPPVVALVTQALADVVADLSSPAAAHVLTALAGDFTGTVGELLTTTAAIAA